MIYFQTIIQSTKPLVFHFLQKVTIIALLVAKFFTLDWVLLYCLATSTAFEFLDVSGEEA
jgi:hypothetical protein